MEPYEYETMYHLEGSYWWYRGLHGILLDVLRSLGVDSNSRVLDAGCGTGQNMARIRDSITERVYGFDYATYGARFCKKRGLPYICVASVNDIPFSSGTFDAVMSIDVLECDDVAEDRALRELVRVVRPGGYLVLVVPAYDWLLSEQHHRAVKASRRYSRGQLASLLSVQGIEIVRMTNLFATLLPVVVAYRLSLKYLDRSVKECPRSELKPMPPILNEFLFRIVDIERRFLKRVNLPFGSSILAVSKKVSKRGV